MGERGGGLARMTAEVIAEVVMAARGADHVPGEVFVAQGVLSQADCGVAVAPLIPDIGEGTERHAKALDVVGVLEGLSAVQQQGQRVVDAAEADQGPVVVEPGPGDPACGRAAVLLAGGDGGVQVERVVPAAELMCRLAAGVEQGLATFQGV
jgi:hypothetical protein